MISMNRNKTLLNSIMNNSLWDLPSSSTMTYFWNFGSMLGMCMVIQLLSGLFISFHYTSFSSESFSSVFIILQEVWYGWMVRFTHINGASLFFLFIYLHLFRGLFYMSSSNSVLWISGVFILLLLMAISFMGYVLPWGQMSYWGVAVITNLFSVIPIVGDSVVNWIWGGFSVSAPTLTRFYSFHFILPMVLILVILSHLGILHLKGSSNSMGMNSNLDKISFHPYFSIKDMVLIVFIIWSVMMIISVCPMLTLDPSNNIPANPLQTPTHIQPEWYFLVSYAILRSMPNKVLGVLFLVFSIAIFSLLILNKYEFSTKFNYYRYIIFWAFVASFFMLMKLGSMTAEEPFILMGMVWSSIYFTSILLLNL